MKNDLDDGVEVEVRIALDFQVTGGYEYRVPRTTRSGGKIVNVTLNIIHNIFTYVARNLWKLLSLNKQDVIQQLTGYCFT